MKTPEQATSFGILAKDYQRYRRSYDKRVYDLLFSLLKQKDLSILDIGCGTGKSTEPLIKFAGSHNVTVTGIDPDEAMLVEARKSVEGKLPITYIQGTAQELPFEAGTFDAVTSAAAFHWFGDKQSLSQIGNVLKEGGLVFIYWTQYLKTEKPAIGKELFGKYNWKAIPKEFREQAFVSGLLIDAGFRDVAEAKIGFTETKTVADIIGMFKTNSTYSLMSAEVRKTFISEMTQAHNEALGDEKTVTENLEIRICYGFK